MSRTRPKIKVRTIGKPNPEMLGGFAMLIAERIQFERSKQSAEAAGRAEPSIGKYANNRG